MTADLPDLIAQFLATTIDPVCGFLPDGTIVYSNPAHDALFAHRFPEGTLGSNIVDIEPDHAKKVSRAPAISARPGDDEEIVLELPSIDENGEGHWFQWRSTRQYDDAGNVRAIFSIGRDITAERLAELRLQRVADQLADSNRDLLEFAQVASHDLQEPLRKVTAFSGRIIDSLGDDLPPKVAEYSTRMNAAVERMQRLIDDLLTFSRVNTRDANMVHTPLDEILNGVLSDLEVLIGETGAEVHIGKMPTLPVDRTQMRQLFQNLIGNALKFRQEGVVPVISIEATHVLPTTFGGDEPPMGWYDIEVSDNGIGFDTTFVDRIFVPFQRLHARNEYQGTGVGLSVCRRIVERHQGWIAATSSEGRGSTFAVRLPTAHFVTTASGDDPTSPSKQVFSTTNGQTPMAA